MDVIFESHQSQAEICFALTAHAQRLGLSVLAVHDLGENLLQRGRDFDEAGVLYSLISWPVADALLLHDAGLARCLPWRFAVYTRAGTSCLAFQGLQLPPDTPPRLCALVAEVEEKLRQLAEAGR